MIKLTTGQKIFLSIFCFGIAIVGFIVKLPSSFRHVDKEMHSLFYFLAAAFLNILFAKRNVIIHAVIFGFLYLFGIGIEYAQAYSNKFFRTRIHGRFDPEDVQANLKGIIIFSIVWLIITSIVFVYKQLISYKPSRQRQSS